MTNKPKFISVWNIINYMFFHWVSSPFLQELDNKSFVELDVNKLGTFLVTSIPKTETFEVTPQGCLYQSRLSRHITVRFPKRATEKNMQCSLRVWIDLLIYLLLIYFISFFLTWFQWKSYYSCIACHQKTWVPPKQCSPKAWWSISRTLVASLPGFMQNLMQTRYSNCQPSSIPQSGLRPRSRNGVLKMEDVYFYYYITWPTGSAHLGA